MAKTPNIELERQSNTDFVTIETTDANFVKVDEAIGKDREEIAKIQSDVTSHDNEIETLDEEVKRRASLNHTHNASAIVSGVLPIDKGGTGTSAIAQGNIVVRGATAFEGRSGVGALHSVTQNNPVFGTLPINCGGTGATTAQGARDNLGVTSALSGKANTSHTHGVADISGILPVSKGGTGVASYRELCNKLQEAGIFLDFATIMYSLFSRYSMSEWKNLVLLNGATNVPSTTLSNPTPAQYRFSENAIEIRGQISWTPRDSTTAIARFPIDSSDSEFDSTVKDFIDDGRIRRFYTLVSGEGQDVVRLQIRENGTIYVEYVYSLADLKKRTSGTRYIDISCSIPIDKEE